MVTIKFETENAAFGDCDEDAALEITRILRELADRIEKRGMDSLTKVRDINGNTIGTIEW